MTVTNPDKVFFPERGETKLDVIRYYLAVSEPFLRAADGRPPSIRNSQTSLFESPRAARGERLGNS
jgi:DNA primase